MRHYKIGDIVFVSHYRYKDNKYGNNHIFVIIDEMQAVEINYFGFLLSSKKYKIKYPYNLKLEKNKINNLHKDSIVKCDDLILILENEIQFKIGKVSNNDLQKFIKVYEKYLDSI